MQNNVDLTVDKFNKINVCSLQLICFLGLSLTCVSIVRAVVCTVSCSVKSYITFMATETLQMDILLNIKLKQNRCHGKTEPTASSADQLLNQKHYCLISVILPPIVMHLAAEATKHGTSIALMMNPSTNLQRECVPSKRKLNQCVFIDQR
ncbi:unnamed protein product [Brassica oleracea]